MTLKKVSVNHFVECAQNGFWHGEIKQYGENEMIESFL